MDRQLDETYERFEMEGVRRGGGVPAWLWALLGCGCGCALLIAAVLGGLAWVTNWALKPGYQYDAGWIVAEKSAGVFRADALQEDPGVIAWLQELVAAYQREPRGPGAPGGAWPGTEEAIAEGLGGLAPREAAAALELGADGRPRWVAAANFSSWVRPLRSLLGAGYRARAEAGESGVEVSEHEGVELWRERRTGGGELIVAFAEGTLLLADGADLARGAVDRLHGRREGGAELAGAWTELSAERGDWDLWGRVRDRGQDLRETVRRVLGWTHEQAERHLAFLPERFATLFVGADVESAQRATFELRLECLDAETAARVRAAAIDQLWQLAQHVDSQSEMTLEYGVSVEGETVVARLALNGLASLAAPLARAMAAPRGR